MGARRVQFHKLPLHFAYKVSGPLVLTRFFTAAALRPLVTASKWWTRSTPSPLRSHYSALATNSDGLTPSALAIARTVLQLGLRTPRSMSLSKVEATPALSASCCWVSPRRSRISLNCWDRAAL
jgi:hypothetical protein